MCCQKCSKNVTCMVSEFLLSFSSTLSVLAFSFDKTLLELRVPFYKNGCEYGGIIVKGILSNLTWLVLKSVAL